MDNAGKFNFIIVLKCYSTQNAFGVHLNSEKNLNWVSYSFLSGSYAGHKNDDKLLHEPCMNSLHQRDRNIIRPQRSDTHTAPPPTLK